MIPIGRGAGAGFQDDRLMVVAGPLFAQIERERADGPRWSLALREGRKLREQATDRLVAAVYAALLPPTEPK